MKNKKTLENFASKTLKKSQTIKIKGGTNGEPETTRGTVVIVKGGSS